MNHRMILHTLGTLVLLGAALMLLPALCAVFYAEWWVALSFVITAAGAAALGLIARFFTRGCDRMIFAREGFVITACAWLLFSAIGAVPFVISGDIPSYVDAFFETVSGFTTTGASILKDVTVVSHGALFWRSFTHWTGGMGVLVLFMAILPDSEGRSIHILRAEMPGPVVDKIVPRVRDTAKILYLIYISLTLLEVAFLLFGGMSFFESLIFSFGTAGTGGFAPTADSLASATPYAQWVITVFMLLFGVNFNLYFLLLIRRFKNALASEELRVYLIVVVLSAAVVAFNVAPLFEQVGDAIRHASFQVASIMTTTGFSSIDFNLWPRLSKVILICLMFIGGCAGSTAGGLKVSRIVILVKSIRRELNRLLHPRAVASVRFEGKPLDDTVRSGVANYFALYLGLFAVISFVVCLEPFNLETNLTAVAACINNVGPGLSLVGPMSNYSAYSGITKIVLSCAMLLGRLEIYPIILTLLPGRTGGLRGLFSRRSGRKLKGENG